MNFLLKLMELCETMGGRHGSIEVGFQVFEDFMSYHNGTYTRTAGSPGPKGGHAVKLVGWGVDPKGVDYWIAANSWYRAFVPPPHIFLPHFRLYEVASLQRCVLP